MVPLELPAIDPAQPGPSAAGEGVTQSDDLTEEEQKKLDAVGWRMLNLPLIVCHSANGMPFFFPLQKVISCFASFCLANASSADTAAPTSHDYASRP